MGTVSGPSAALVMEEQREEQREALMEEQREALACRT